MQCFGLFELGSVLASGGGTTTYEARKQTDPAGRYVVKVFSPEKLVPEDQADTRSELDPLLQELGAEFAGRIIVQREAAETSPCFVPVVGAGSEDRGTWYAMRYYTRSVQRLFAKGTVWEARDLFHLLQELVRAALHLKRTNGRSHGNLKPANIFVDGLRKVQNSPVLVADALAGDFEDAQRFERADLRAIGELLYQGVLGGKVDFAQLSLPLEPGLEWSRTFSKQAGQWAALCNRLLAKQLPGANMTLEILERELNLLEPKRVLPLMPFAVPAIVLVLLGSTIFAFLHHRQPNPPTVSSDLRDSAGSDRTGISTDGAANLSQEGAILFDLQPQEIRDHAIIQRGDTKFSGAMTSFSQTPGEAVLYRVEAPGYESYMTNISVRPKEARHVSVRLVRQPVPVSLVSIPPGIPFFTTDNALVKKAGEFYLLPWGSVEIVARHPRLGARTNFLMLSLDHPNSAPPFRFNFGALILTNLPQDCSVTEGSASVGTPADRVVYEPLGPHSYLLRGKSTFQSVVTNIVAGENYLLPTSMAK